MKPILTVRLMSLDPMDRETMVDVGSVPFEATGEAIIVLTRDEMGCIKLVNAEVKGDGAFTDAVNEAKLAIKELHEALSKAEHAAKVAHIDLAYLHKCLTRE